MRLTTEEDAVMIITRFALPRATPRGRGTTTLLEHFLKWRCPLIAYVLAQQLREIRP